LFEHTRFVTEMKYRTSAMGYLIRTLTVLVAISPAAVPQTSDVAQIERRGDSASLSVNTFRPLDAIATKLESHFGIAVSAEDPVFQFRGDMMDISLEVPRIRPGTLVPARWGFEVRFPLNLDGSLQNVRDLLAGIVAESISGRLLHTGSMNSAAHSSLCPHEPVMLRGGRLR
jgi:hypothetical protein